MQQTFIASKRLTAGGKKKKKKKLKSKNYIFVRALWGVVASAGRRPPRGVWWGPSLCPENPRKKTDSKSHNPAADSRQPLADSPKPPARRILSAIGRQSTHQNGAGSTISAQPIPRHHLSACLSCADLARLTARGIHPKLQANFYRPSSTGYPSAVSRQPSAISHQPSASAVCVAPFGRPKGHGLTRPSQPRPPCRLRSAASHQLQAARNSVAFSNFIFNSYVPTTAQTAVSRQPQAKIFSTPKSQINNSLLKFKHFKHFYHPLQIRAAHTTKCAPQRPTH
jgi:hypothetical protein